MSALLTIFFSLFLFFLSVFFSVLFVLVCSFLLPLFFCSFVLVFFFLLLSIPAFFFVLFIDVVLWCLKTVVYGNQVHFESLKNSAGTCTKLIYVAYIYILDTYWRNDNRHSNKGRRKEGRIKEDTRGRHRKKRRRIKTQEDFFNNIFTSQFIARFERVV